MPGANSTADSTTKLHNALMEKLTLDAAQKATANWKAAQRVAWGEHTNEADLAGTDEMMMVDSKIVTNHYHNPPLQPAQQQPQPQQTTPLSAVAPSPSKLSGLAQLGIGAGLLATGAGAGVGIPMALNGLKGLLTPTTSQVQVAPPQQTVTVPVAPALPPAWMLELGKPMAGIAGSEVAPPPPGE